MSRKKNNYGAVFQYVIIVCIIQCTSFVRLSGQDPVFSQFMFDGLNINPGYAGINDYIKVTAGYRNQWPLLGSAYTTYLASYDQPIPSINSGVGIQVISDIAGGVYSRNSIELFYNYQFHVTKELVVSPGLQIAVAQRKLKAAGLTLPDQNPYTGSGSAEVLADKSSVFPDFGFGVVANYSDRYSFGIAAHHLNGPVETLSDINSKRTPLSLSAHFISYFPVRFGKFDRKKMVFSPGFYFKQQQYQNLFSIGLNTAYDPVFAGVWLRTASGFNPESVIFLVGLEQIGYRIVYNYDFKLAQTNGEFPHSGAHEITLVLKFQPKKKLRTIKCSKYSF